MSALRALGVVPSGFFVLRTPLLPFTDALSWSEGLEAPAVCEIDAADVDAADLDAAIERDRDVVRKRLHDMLARAEVREAITLASPDLAAALERTAVSTGGRSAERVLHSLARYLWRMAARPTPFGLFAGVSSGPVDPRTRLRLGPRSEYRRVTRLDCYLLDAIVATVADFAPAREQLAHAPNPTLQRTAAGLSFVATRRRRRTRTHHLVVLRETAPLCRTLERARGGATPAQLAAQLADDGIDAGRAVDFVGRLVRSQVLVADLGLTVTADDPLGRLVRELAAVPGGAETAQVLAAARKELDELDRDGLGADPDRYRRLATTLGVLPVDVDPALLVQVDLVKPTAQARLGTGVVAEIAAGVRLLHLAARPRPESDLDRFRTGFVERYEERAVPLLEALDPTLGVGFGPPRDSLPLLHEIPFASPAPPGAPGTKFDELLLEKFAQALAAAEQEITLTLREAEERADPSRPPLPAAFAAVASLGAASDAALDRGEFEVVVSGVSGPSGARLLGRFCHADPALREHVAAHLRAEEALDRDAVYAEIVHLPRGRTGNVLLRPALRSYEIPYLGRSGVSAERQIPVSDLLVTVRDGTVELRSARLGRRVVPRLTSAHNYTRGCLPLYRFLCALQEQGTVSPGLEWSWGPLAGAPFLPRVRAGRVLLAPARWRVLSSELQAWRDRRPVGLFRAVQAWRHERRVPRLVLLVDGDNKLPIDLDNIVSVEVLAHAARAGGKAVLEEMRPPPEQLCAAGPEGRFTAELVVPFVSAHPAALARPSPVATSSARRRFPPNSEWVYAKLYTSGALADAALRDVVAPLCEELLDEGSADAWFFVRYADPDPHLRIRFHGDHSGIQPRVAGRFAAALEGGLGWRVQFDTYEREVERYGGPEGVELTEAAFHADSDAVLGLLANLEPGDVGAQERWRLAVRGVDQLLVDAGLDLDARLLLAQRARHALALRMGADARTESALSRRFQAERAGLERLLDRGRDAGALQPGVVVLAERSQRLAPLLARLGELHEAGRLTVPVHDIVVSYVHMFLNRLCRARNTAQEFVVYDFLTRLYRSLAARPEV